MCSQPICGIYLAMLAIDCLCSLSPPLATPLCSATNKSSKPIFLWLIPTSTCFPPIQVGLRGGLKGGFRACSLLGTHYTAGRRQEVGSVASLSLVEVMTQPQEARCASTSGAYYCYVSQKDGPAASRNVDNASTGQVAQLSVGRGRTPLLSARARSFRITCAP